MVPCTCSGSQPWCGLNRSTTFVIATTSTISSKLAMRIVAGSTGQDANATIKRQLQLLLPKVEIFLDIDDLESLEKGVLEKEVHESAAMFVLVTPKERSDGKEGNYFTSHNCMRELRAAVESGVRRHHGREGNRPNTMMVAGVPSYAPETIVEGRFALELELGQSGRRTAV